MTTTNGHFASGDAPERTMGYEATFVEEPDKKYICPVCLVVMRDAMQTSCGHRFCQTCITRVASRRSSLCKCPVDNTSFHMNEELFPDIAIRREILSLKVYCDQHGNGCCWTGELRDLQNHVTSCGYIEVQCDFGCNEGKIRRMELSAHLEQCDLRSVRCEHCNCSTTFVDITRHQLLDCRKFPVVCSLCGKSGIYREDIPSHLNQKTGDCPRTIIPCPFERYGCQFSGRREIMSNHVKDNSHLHLNCVVQTVDSQDKTISSLKEQVKQLDRLVTSSSQAFRPMSYNGRLLWKVPLDPSLTKYVSQPFYTGCPGYKLRISLELYGHIESNRSYASLFVIHEKGEFDDDLLFPLNASCTVSLFSKQSSDVLVTSIACFDVPRCRSDSEISNCQRGVLRFILTDTLLSEKYMIEGSVYLDVSIELLKFAAN